MTNVYFRYNLKANHNKDYSVVKTCKAASVAFFVTDFFMAVHLLQEERCAVLINCNSN